MSATNRGGQRVEHDFYETPRWASRRLLEHEDQDFLLDPKLTKVEPCAGRGHIIRSYNEYAGYCYAKDGIASKPVAKSLFGWTAIDIDSRHENDLEMLPHGPSVIIQDSLTVDLKFDVGITNPPFALAFEMVQHWRPRLGHLYMLLRLGFLGSDERSSYLRRDEPDLYVLPDRCEFAMSVKCKAKKICGFKQMFPLPHERPSGCPGCGGHVSIVTADSAEYAWFHWWPGQTGKYRILQGTPVAERKAGHDR